MNDDTALNRIYCLSAAVVLSEKHIETLHTARIVALDEQLKTATDSHVITAAWRRMQAETLAVMKKHALVT